jgi:mono/diheme cytochrome c family protein
MKKFIKWVLALVVLGALGFIAVVFYDKRTAPYVPPKQADTEEAKAASIERGRYIARAGDCMACHTDPHDGQMFSGGYALDTPFGKIVASNITPDKATGIGDWTEQQFVRAVREGKGAHGENLYPAMPYPAYAKVSDADMHDLWNYMQTVEPVKNKVDANQLPFPFSIRSLVAGWNLLFFDRAGFAADAAQTDDWNRGKYLVDGLGHCASCHTAKNPLGADARGVALQGGSLQGWFAPDITANPHTGIGGWSNAQLVRYLKEGGNDIAMASGPMAEAVENSTQHLTAEDLNAIATYLKAVPGRKVDKPAAVPAQDAQMVQGQRLYAINCAACHDSKHQGVDGMVSALAGNPGVQQDSAENILRAVLVGNRAAATASNPTAAGMPAFDWKLDDDQIAAIATYIRNSEGNAAPRVDATDVAAARKALLARGPLSQD